MTRSPRLDVRALAQDQRGNAAAELALAIPLLVLLFLGAIEMGNYFVSAHHLQKGVRDAARYAARVPYGDLSTGGCTYATGSAADTAIRNLARTGSVDASRQPRLNFWTDNATVNVTMVCDTSGDYAGAFEDNVDGAPQVTVRARVPYPTLFGYPFLPDLLFINAEQEAAVFGA
ncbi:TadE/TadG family type IV pilus assembly protein [Sphingomicrobium astaxanthinifaciens]|uniref:TadE/TadG family type IV pilus assembly protein n=1 Tax=Sphingomicrobium astaxanthinifaciens TaxID=1227949 RepID=UPI001FCC1061|nr:TadE/TadG family type IV pilus assembly protein [Sphingomicrobium astaxanthinifaciens]MCJ7421284.1 pilus assembly protein [Sphingomicrobium astaxanthinifaciens]